jgi:pyridoxamine 5'-phosphate oxidase
MRKDFHNETLDEKTIDRDPIQQLQSWLKDAEDEHLLLPEAMTLATATKDGRPSARMVLLKKIDDQGLDFYTNYNSDKSRELDQNPVAALVFFWPSLERQVRVVGSVTRVSDEESDQYFRTRPRDSQIGAIASPQSEVIEREDLEKRFSELEERYRDRVVDRPAHWGGYRLNPDQFEFWKGRPGRLHDRILYKRQSDASWIIKRLAP